MNAVALKTKMTFTEERTRRHHLTIAKSCRDAAKVQPWFACGLRQKMRQHARIAIGKTTLDRNECNRPPDNGEHAPKRSKSALSIWVKSGLKTRMKRPKAISLPIFSVVKRKTAN